MYLTFVIIRCIINGITQQVLLVTGIKIEFQLCVIKEGFIWFECTACLTLYWIQKFRYPEHIPLQTKILRYWKNETEENRD